MIIKTWTDITIEALQGLWAGVLEFIPNLIGEIIVFVIGWIVAIGVGKLVEKILDAIKFNKVFERGGWKEAMAKAELKVDATRFVGAIVKWTLVIVFLLAAVEIMGLDQFADFLKSILAYLPNVIVATLIFVVTIIVVDIVEKIVRASVERIKVGYGHLVSLIVKWSIWIFAILTILHQLKIARPFMETLFIGVVAIIVITCGLAFGLGGKETAAEILESVKKKVKGQ